MPRLALAASFALLPLLTVNCEPSALPFPQKPSISLSPRYSPGQSLRYQVELRTVTESQSSGIVANPQAPSALTLSVSLQIHLEVSAAAAPAPAGSLNLRATFENVTVAVRTDAFDPAAADLEETYRRLQGVSVNFTVDPTGKILSAENSTPPAAPANPAASQEWLADLIRGASASESTPATVTLGQSWSNERALPKSPLAGLSIRSTSTYLRDEPCRTSFSSPPTDSTSAPPAPQTTVPAPNESCAVILTKFSTPARPSDAKDATPPDYKSRGLITSGTWSASGESLTYISLRTGITWSTTQSGEEQMDFTITALPLPPESDEDSDSASSAPQKPSASKSASSAAKSSSPKPSKSQRTPPPAPTSQHFQGRVRTSSSLTLLP